MKKSSSAASARAFGALLKAMLLISFPFGILQFILPIYSLELGATGEEVGILFSATAIVPIFVRPFLGRALDRWGRRPFLLLGLGSYAIAMLVFSFSNTILLLGVARLIQGIGQAFLWLSATTIVADLAAETGRGLDFGRFDEASNRGVLIGTGLGLAIYFGLQHANLPATWLWFWLFIAYTIPSVIALWFGWREVPETRPAAAIAPVRAGKLSGQLLALMAIVMFTGASMAMIGPFLMIFLQQTLGTTPTGLALAYTPAALIGAFLPSRMGWITDRLGRKRPMALGLITSAISSAAIPQLRSLVPMAALWALESIGYAASAPAERAFVADIAGEDVRGINYGLYTFAYFLGAALGPLAGGWLYDHVSPAAPFFWNAVALFVGALLVLGVLREPREKA